MRRQEGLDPKEIGHCLIEDYGFLLDCVGVDLIVDEEVVIF